MHAVIGTAGHVDHGKSTLIHALTGVHPSHLPQELARGMTIDLGFAHFTTSQGDLIGIIDVPGHERFIRNMVSSVWGLDMVLFIVAADEGWAALSEEHLRVISAMSIQRMIVVLTKCDLVDEAQIHAVENDVLERILVMTDQLPEVIRVSAQTGQGIAELKGAISQQVQSLDSRNLLYPTAHYYVDRVFSVSGVGTTVTGTLRGEGLKEGDVLTLFPSLQSVRIRSLQSYHQQLNAVEPHSRVAIGLKQVNRKIISRGSCLVADAAAVTVSKDWIVRLNPQFSELKKQSEVEVALGTAHTQAKCYVFAEGQLARLQLKKSIPAFWGQPLLLIQHGGSRIIGAGRLVWMQALDKTLRTNLLEALPALDLTSTDASARLSLELTLNGYATRDPLLSPAENTEELGNWWLTAACRQHLFTACHQVLQQSIHAMTGEELARKAGYPQSMVEALIALECEEKHWQRIDGGIISVEMREDGALPADQAHLLEQIQAGATQGFDAAKVSQPGIQRLLRALTERQLIIPTVDKIFFYKEIYDQLVVQIIQHRSVGEEFNVADARERVGLSRKQLIPLLNRMERDGWVKRIGDNRIVIKALG